jgi:predicted transposase YbfD/YdcC
MVVYGVTSLTREQADAERLLNWVRGHWGIENKVHYVRDQTMSEDACRVRTKDAPVILATIRNAILNVLRRDKVKNIAARQRTYAADPVKAIQAIQYAQT